MRVQEVRIVLLAYGPRQVAFLSVSVHLDSRPATLSSAYVPHVHFQSRMMSLRVRHIGPARPIVVCIQNLAGGRDWHLLSQAVLSAGWLDSSIPPGLQSLATSSCVLGRASLVSLLKTSELDCFDGPGADGTRTRTRTRTISCAFQRNRLRRAELRAVP